MMAAAVNTGLKLNMFVTPCRIPIEHLLQNLNVAIRGKFRNACYGIVMIGILSL